MMNNNNYSIEDIQIGDEILFDSTHKVEHNIFWRVVNKISKSKLVVEIREMGYAEKFNIDIRDVVSLKTGALQFEECHQ
jgi:hypothetical protein